MKQQAWGVADLTRRRRRASRCKPFGQLRLGKEREGEEEEKERIKTGKWAPHVSSGSHFLCLRPNRKRVDPIPLQPEKK